MICVYKRSGFPLEAFLFLFSSTCYPRFLHSSQELFLALLEYSTTTYTLRRQSQAHTMSNYDIVSMSFGVTCLVWAMGSSLFAWYFWRHPRVVYAEPEAYEFRGLEIQLGQLNKAPTEARKNQIREQIRGNLRAGLLRSMEIAETAGVPWDTVSNSNAHAVADNACAVADNAGQGN